jgi:hypothetical protein
VLEYHPEGARLVRDDSLRGTFRRSVRLLARLFSGSRRPATQRPSDGPTRYPRMRGG